MGGQGGGARARLARPPQARRGSRSTPPPRAFAGKNPSAMAEEGEAEARPQTTGHVKMAALTKAFYPFSTLQRQKTTRIIERKCPDSPYLHRVCAPRREPTDVGAEYREEYDAVVMLGSARPTDQLESAPSVEDLADNNYPKYDVDLFNTHGSIVASTIRSRLQRSMMREAHLNETWHVRRAKYDARIARMDRKERASIAKRAEQDALERRERLALEKEEAKQAAINKQKEIVWLRNKWVTEARAKKDEFLARFYEGRLDLPPQKEKKLPPRIADERYKALMGNYVKPVDFGPFGVRSVSAHILPNPGLNIPLKRRSVSQRPRRDVLSVSTVGVKGPGGYPVAPPKSDVWVDVHQKGGKKGKPRTALEAPPPRPASVSEMSPTKTKDESVFVRVFEAPSSLAAPKILHHTELKREPLPPELKAPLGASLHKVKDGEAKEETGPSVGM